MSQAGDDPFFDELLRRLRAGERIAWDELIQHLQLLKTLNGWARQRMKQARPGGARPSDLTQRTLLKAFKHIESFDQDSQESLLAWLQRILHHEFVNMLRAAGSQMRGDSQTVPLDDLEVTHPSDPQRSPSQHTLRGEEAQRLREALLHLKESQREVLSLVLEDLRRQEIVDQLDLSPDAVTSLISRGKKALLEHLSLLPPSTLVGDYQILRWVTAGASSDIYEARLFNGGGSVAVKVLFPEHCDKTELRDRFRNEARTLLEIRHPHLVKALSQGILADNRPFMGLEWVAEDLHGALAQVGGRLPVLESAQIIRQLAVVLSVLHERKIFHRDLKPENILVARRGPGDWWVQLADLGLAKQPSGTRAGSSPVSTAGDARFGTWAYMAPEHWDGTKQVNAPADVYSLGVLWFQLLTGQVPFKADSQNSWVSIHARRQKPPLERLDPLVPQPTRELITRMLARSPLERPTSQDLLGELPARSG